MKKILRAIALSFALLSVGALPVGLTSCAWFVDVVDVVTEPPGAVRASEFLPLLEVALADAERTTGAADPAVVAAYHVATRAGDPVSPLLAAYMRAKFGLLPTMRGAIDERGRIAVRFYSMEVRAFLARYLVDVVAPAESRAGAAGATMIEKLEARTMARTHGELLRLIDAATPVR